MHTVMSSHTDTAIIFSYAASVNYPALNFLVTTGHQLYLVVSLVQSISLYKNSPKNVGHNMAK